MARFGRRYGFRRSSRYGFRRYRRPLYRRRSRRYVNGSSRSVVKMKTSFTSTTKITAGHGTTAGTVSYSSPLGGNTSLGSLAHSDLFQHYVQLYEEMRIIGVRVDMAVISAIGGQDTPSLQIYTAFDRKRGYGEPAATGAEIIAASSRACATALNNNVAKLSRYCGAGDLQERSVWLESKQDTEANGFQNLSWLAAARNPTFFCPSFMCTTICPSLGADHQIDVSFTFTYYVAFRSPKFGGGAANRLLGSANIFETLSVPEVRSQPPDLMVDDDGEIDLAEPGDMSSRASSLNTLASEVAPASKTRVLMPPNA